jgi:starch phosphorylase
MILQDSKLAQMLRLKTKRDKDSLIRHFVHHLEYTVGKYIDNITPRDLYLALAYTVRDYLIDQWNEVQEIYKIKKVKKLYYLSMEFLMGKMLKSNLINMGALELARNAAYELGFDLEDIFKEEPDAGLGNGGLGRLAACFLDSLATLNYPATGCSLLYEYGIFEQKIIQGNQVETPDHWLSIPNPWLILRTDSIYPIGFYGRVEEYVDHHGIRRKKWIPDYKVLAQAYDILIPGFRTKTVLNLRLWKAEASKEFDFNYFSHGDYVKAVQDKIFSENITQVLYPNDNNLQGKELRLKQEYFLVSATIHNALTEAFFGEEKINHDVLPERVFFQLNDTHPALAIPEFIRILVDEHKLDLFYAWDIAKQCFGYTNHTVMPEALEKWDLDMIKYLLPRHLEIIFELNHYFLEDLRKKGYPEEIIRDVSVVEESLPKKIRMANLAIIGSKVVNGVSEIHTKIVKENVFKNFYKINPEKFQNKTNGITFRRWLFSANEELTKLINDTIGKRWVFDLNYLRNLEQFINDSSFLEKFKKVKLKKKEQLAKFILNELGIKVDPNSIFDIQIKRIHEYKRQHLNILRIIADYQYLKDTKDPDYYPRTFIFSGKAAPGYFKAKLIIKLIHAVAEKINHDRDVNDKMKIVFLPNYSVSLAEQIIPACDISEQISTAGTEASGTGNMKFMLNGAITIGTLDGANIEMLEEVGKENIYIFGKTVEELEELKKSYDPVNIYQTDPIINGILNTIYHNIFNPTKPGEFQEIFYSLTYGGDVYFLLADFYDYWNTHKKINYDYKNEKEWIKKMVYNTCRSIKFSSDRTIKEYAKEIWNLSPVNPYRLDL